MNLSICKNLFKSLSFSLSPSLSLSLYFKTLELTETSLFLFLSLFLSFFSFALSFSSSLSLSFFLLFSLSLSLFIFKTHIFFSLSLSISFSLLPPSCPVDWGCRIHQLYLCRGVSLPNKCLGYNAKNLMVRFQQCWNLGECGALLYCHCFQVHSEPE